MSLRTAQPFPGSGPRRREFTDYPSLPPGVVDAIPVRPPRALIIDDEDTIRFALRRYFTRRGWEFDEAADGARGLELIRAAATRPDPSAQYALIFSDVKMPGISGIDLCTAVASEFPHLAKRLILCSGDVSEPEIGATSLRFGCRILSKPFDLNSLQDLMTEFQSLPE